MSQHLARCAGILRGLRPIAHRLGHDLCCGNTAIHWSDAFSCTSLALCLAETRASAQFYLPVPAFRPQAAEGGEVGTIAGAIHVAQKLIVAGSAVCTRGGVASIVLTAGGAEVRPVRLLSHKDISQVARPARAIQIPASAASHQASRQRHKN